MVTATTEDVLGIFEELNFPSATKLRAALIKRGFKARLKDVEEFVKSQTPTQLFAKAPKYRGKIIASRPNERWVVDFIDFTAEPSGSYKYILLVQDIFSRKLWAQALEDKDMTSAIQQLRNLFADEQKPAEINADGEFDNKTFNRFLSQQNIASRFKEGRQDLATIDAAMNNFKKMLKKLMQDQDTTEWAKLVSRAMRAHNKLSHEALMGNADPNEAYDMSQKNLQFELREEAGKKMAQQNAVVSTNQRNVQDKGAVRQYIGREDIRRRGDRPQYSGSVSLVAAVEGNRVKDDKGHVHSMTLTKPVPQDSESTDIKVRLYGSSQTEDRKREQFKQFAQTLKALLVENGAMFTSAATTELYKREPTFNTRVRQDEVWRIAGTFPEMLKLQTASSGGTSKVMLNR